MDQESPSQPPPTATSHPEAVPHPSVVAGPEQQIRKSRKALLVVVLHIFLYFWKAGKITLRKTSQLLPLRPDTEKTREAERCDQILHRSTWNSLWRMMSFRKRMKKNWELFLKLKQLYRIMFNQLLICAKFTDHLHGVISWKRHLKSILQKEHQIFLTYRKKKDGQKTIKLISHKFIYVRGCLQKLKNLRRPRRNITWGELVHSRNENYQTVIKKYNTRLQLYRKMPLKRLSRLWGKFNELELPIWLRRPMLRLYIWLFNCCLEEAAVQDLRQYPNVGTFFQRRLRPGVRPIDASPLTSPCDGTVLYCGIVSGNTLEQVKGVTYSLKGFLGPVNKQSLANSDCSNETDVDEDLDCMSQLLTSTANHLYQCIIYLAPGDYHRFHSPADWFVQSRRHFPGELFSVNPSIARWLQGLFNFNERVVYRGLWRHGFMSMTPVGATNVGSITIYHDPELLTNVDQTWPSGCFRDKDFTANSIRNGVKMTKGQCFGHFSLGSTIVLLFEAPPCFRFTIKPGQKLKYGQELGTSSQIFSKRRNRKNRKKT